MENSVGTQTENQEERTGVRKQTAGKQKSEGNQAPGIEEKSGREPGKNRWAGSSSQIILSSGKTCQKNSSVH